MSGFDPRLLPALLQLGQQIGGGFTSGLEHSRRKAREQAKLDFQNKQLDEVKAHNQDQADAAALNFDQKVKDYKLRSESEARKTYDASAGRELDRTKVTNEEAWRSAQLVKDRIRAFTGQGMVPDQATLQDPSALDQWTAAQAPKLLDQKLRLATAPGIAGANARFDNLKRQRQGEEAWFNTEMGDDVSLTPPDAATQSTSNPIDRYAPAPTLNILGATGKPPANAIPPNAEVQRKLREKPKKPNLVPLANGILRNFSFNTPNQNQINDASKQLESLLPELKLNWNSLIPRDPKGKVKY